MTLSVCPFEKRPNKIKKKLKETHRIQGNSCGSSKRIHKQNKYTGTHSRMQIRFKSHKDISIEMKKKKRQENYNLTKKYNETLANSFIECQQKAIKDRSNKILFTLIGTLYACSTTNWMLR